MELREISQCRENVHAFLVESAYYSFHNQESVKTTVGIVKFREVPLTALRVQFNQNSAGGNVVINI